MRWAAIILMLSSVCWGEVAPTTRPTTAPATQPSITSQRIEELVKQLAAEPWEVRQKAQDALVQYGIDVRPRLNALLKETRDEEVRTRVEAALRQIEENRTTGASLITLHMKQAKPQEIFQEISRQASAQLRPTPVNLWEAKAWPAIDVDIERQPF